ncbi:MAG: 30S ribosomal protein S7 [Patescibacteria group bacterium]|nr:30S ribosomal protein S7 [Patescibacteria group bacterium]
MRRQHKIKRDIAPDPKFGNVLVQKFINAMMWDGKRSVAARSLYDAFDIVEKQAKKHPIEVFDEAMKNVMPFLEVRSRRIGGANYQVPREVRGERRVALAMRWMIAVARAKKGVPMAKRLADELLAAARNEGAAVKKKNDTHRMAEANRAFAHLAW